MFRPAIEEDFKEIIEIQNENLISQNTDLKYGFLVNPVDDSYLKNDANITFVIQNEETRAIEGYLTGCPITPEKFKELKLTGTASSVFFWKHIALKNKIKGTHIIKSFEDYCFSELKKSGYLEVVGEICLEPLNNRSLSFHVGVQSLREIERRTDEKRYAWGIFTKNIE